MKTIRRPTAQWGPACRLLSRSFPGLLGAAAWWQTGNPLLGVGAAIIILNWPYTMLVIMPVNRRLEATRPEEAGDETRDLLVRWGKLHAGRSALGAIAAARPFAVFEPSCRGLPAQ
ncbi:DUF1772 domain-containing protein [Rhizobium giardinii]|uniref:Uncharacterized protein n=1 Tax=Rhizobium giardinii TaxID=56731 RepID=A0A7W8UHH9_9HYPH|nr:DUF1772 domain-containing protein [Rhizobium giardinii]MBB5539476.1 hypothetical protein [Rhizobium giardinii]